MSNAIVFKPIIVESITLVHLTTFKFVLYSNTSQNSGIFTPSAPVTYIFLKS